MMKLFALTFLILILAGSGLSASYDPIGDMDTVYIDQISTGLGSEFIINVNLWNDEALGAITIPLVYPIDKLEFDTVLFVGGRVNYLDTKPWKIDQTDGTLLVGALVVIEDFIAAGDGPLFSIKFRVKNNVNLGELIIIDSTFIDPANMLLTDSAGFNIFPEFKRGEISVSDQNIQPYFIPLSEMYVSEGDSLIVDLEVIDGDGDLITIVNPQHPYNSSFIDNGDGTARFIWVPDFVGPYSANLNAYKFAFWASDGVASDYIVLEVNVININRPPVIDFASDIEAEAGDSLGIAISAIDPDFDEIEWSVSGLPPGASFDYVNPGLINWPTIYADSGLYNVSLIASDQFGLADTINFDINIMPVSLYSLRIDTLTSFSGKVVELSIDLENELAVNSFNLLLNYDHVILTVLDVSLSGTRAGHMDFFTYRIDENNISGDLRIIGRSEQVPPIEAGNGAICRVTFQVSSNLIYVGYHIPVRFEAHDEGDNSLVINGDEVLLSENINLFDGYVLIDAPGEKTLGDINLNGVSYEISDAVYFTNFYISPTQYPLNERQLLNSDVNRDGFAPSVADLVILVKVISGEIDPPVGKIIPLSQQAEVELVRNDDGLFVSLNSMANLGAAYFRFEGNDVDQINLRNLTDMEIYSRVENDHLNCLLMSYDNKTIPSGSMSVIKLSDDPEIDISLDLIEVADNRGGMIAIEKIESAALPGNFALHQNYPNPFNPSTQIRFDLSEPSWVTLKVFNILGQEINKLIDDQLPAGSQVVQWHGVDDNGRQVASGIYFYRIQAGAFSDSRKMIMMK